MSESKKETKYCIVLKQAKIRDGNVAHIKIGNEGSITDAVQEIIEALPNTEK